MTSTTERKVTGNLSLTLDGRYHGPGGPGDLAAIVPYALTEVGRDHLSRIHEHATTALLGRGNAEGFLGYWSPIASDETADPRDRGYARWLVEAEKVVLSTTRIELPYDRTRVVNTSATDIVTELKGSGTGDILVNTSPSILKPLLAADLVDRLYLMICPEVAGGGARLFDDGLPGSRWTLTSRESGDLGELALVYDRAR
jgi:dihydrofolate reductase